MSECYLWVNEWFIEWISLCMLLLLGQDNFFVEIMHEFNVLNECITQPTDRPTDRAYYRDATMRFDQQKAKILIRHWWLVGFSFIEDLSLSEVVFLRAKVGLVLKETQLSFSTVIGPFVKTYDFHWKKKELDARDAMAFLKTQDSMIFMNALPDQPTNRPTNQPTDGQSLL